MGQVKAEEKTQVLSRTTKSKNDPKKIVSAKLQYFLYFLLQRVTHCKEGMICLMK